MFQPMMRRNSISIARPPPTLPICSLSLPITRRPEQGSNARQPRVKRLRSMAILRCPMRQRGPGLSRQPRLQPQPRLLQLQPALVSTQYEGSQTASVGAGVVANQSAIQSGNSDYTSKSGQVGSSLTVMAAFDANTGIRTQNGVTFNTVIGSANLLVQALNLINLATVNQSSQSGGALTYPVPTTTRPSPICPAGSQGLGTIASPCVGTNSTCLTAGAPANACVERRYIDTYGNVIYYLTSSN